MRPAEVCGCWTNPSSSRRARMLRTVADEMSRPDALAINADGTGSPDAIYSRTSAANTRPGRPPESFSTRDMGLLSQLYTSPLSGLGVLPQSVPLHGQL